MGADPIDRATFAELQTAAGAEFVRELVDTFLTEAPPMLAELRSSLAAGRAEPFRRAAHSLKSNASTFGALTLAAMARELELNGLAAANVAASVDALATHYGEVAAALKAIRDA